jgi:5'-3' exonuclease
LWVILLPFIDEKKLTEALQTVEDQFTEDERRRNSFGPAYLFIHSSHPLFPSVKDFYQLNSIEKSLNIENCNGFSAALEIFCESTILPLNEELKIPKNFSGYFHEVPSNQVLCFEYKNPEYSHHVCELLPGAKEQDPVLESRDVLFPKFPRLNRSFTISDLGKNDFPDYFFYFNGIQKDGSHRMISNSDSQNNNRQQYHQRQQYRPKTYQHNFKESNHRNIPPPHYTGSRERTHSFPRGRQEYHDQGYNANAQRDYRSYSQGQRQQQGQSTQEQRKRRQQSAPHSTQGQSTQEQGQRKRLRQQSQQPQKSGREKQGQPAQQQGQRKRQQQSAQESQEQQIQPPQQQPTQGQQGQGQRKRRRQQSAQKQQGQQQTK